MTERVQQRTSVGPPTGSAQVSAWHDGDHRRVLFKALSSLARTGYPAPPGEGMDLIHDFYIEAWPAITMRYDAARASFDTYLFACFVRFARPRIVRLARLRATLMTPAELQTIEQDRGLAFQDNADAADIPAVRAALAALPPHGRTLLAAYLDDAAPSERALAARFGMTRHAIRVELADMLGLLAVRLGTASSLDEPDRTVAVALWSEQRSPRQIAARLGMRTEDVQATKSRIFTRLVEAVRGTRKMTTIGRTDEQAAAILVAAALAPEATARDLDAVRDRAEAICAYLDTVEHGEEAEVLLAAGQERIATFYAALAGTAMEESRTHLTAALLAPFLEARAEDERQVGQALETLVAGVSGAWYTFQRCFRTVPRLDEDLAIALRTEPSLKDLGPEVRAMATYGMTPVVVAEATRSMSNVAMDFCRQRGIAVRGRLQMEAAQPGHRTGDLPLLERWTTERELGLDLDLERETASALYAWLHGLAGELPLLFDGFEAGLDRGMLILTRTDATEPDLFKRWHPRPAAAVAC